MKRIDCIVNGEEHTFRTNDSGAYLFTGVSQNSQISCDSGFDSLRKIKREIKEYFVQRDIKTRIKFRFPLYHQDWKA